MKQIKLVILAIVLSLSTAQADNHNLTSDAIGNLIYFIKGSAIQSYT